MRYLSTLLIAFCLLFAGCSKDDEENPKGQNNTQNRGEGMVTFRVGSQFYDFDVYDFELPWSDYCGVSNPIFCHTTIKARGKGNSNGLELALQWPFFSAGGQNCDLSSIGMTVYNRDSRDTILFASSFTQCNVNVYSVWGLQLPVRDGSGQQISPAKLEDLEADFSGQTAQGTNISNGALNIALKP